MSHVIWHCNGVGPIEGYDEIKMPHYENGISTYAWAPPHDMSRAEVLRVDSALERLRMRQLEIISKATGGEIIGEYSRHEDDDST